MKMINYPLTTPLNTVIIRNLGNGFHVISFTESEEGTFYPVEEVFEAESEFPEPNFAKVKELLYYLLDLLGVYNSKHFKKRLEITVINNG